MLPPIGSPRNTAERMGSLSPATQRNQTVRAINTTGKFLGRSISPTLQRMGSQENLPPQKLTHSQLVAGPSQPPRRAPDRLSPSPQPALKQSQIFPPPFLNQATPQKESKTPKKIDLEPFKDNFAQFKLKKVTNHPPPPPSTS